MLVILQLIILLLRSNALLWALDPMIKAVPDDMCQRIAQQIDHLTVKFSIGAIDDQLGLFAEIMREDLARWSRVVRDAKIRID